jgi:NAD-dependent dihydropyrimidine dehydrogenase PreA subunit
VCRCGGLVTADKSVRVVHVANCDGCGECELVCPTGAISFSFEVVIEGPQD